MSAFERTFLIGLQAGLAARVGSHMAKFGDKVAVSLRESIERGAQWSAVDWVNALGQRTAVYRRVNALLQRFDFLLSPTLSRPALAVDHDAFKPITIAGEEAGTDPRRLVSLSLALQPLRPPGDLAAVRLVLRRPAHRPADRRSLVRRPPRPRAGRSPRARAPVRAPDASLLSLGDTSCRSRPRASRSCSASTSTPRRCGPRRDPKNAERPIVMSQGAYGWKVGMPRILDLLARYGLRVTFFVPGPRHGAAPGDGRGDPEGRPRDRAPLLVARLDRQPDARAGARGDGQGHRDHHAHDGAEAGRLPLPGGGVQPPHAQDARASTGSATPRTTSTTTRRISTGSTASSPTSSSSRSRGCWTTRRSSSTRSRCPGGPCRPRPPSSRPGAGSSTCSTARTGTSASPCIPQIIGRPSRITLLEELIQYILGHPRVWLARCDEVADALRPALRAEARA